MAYNGFHQSPYQDATNRAQHSSSRYHNQQQPMPPQQGQNLQHPMYTQGQAGYGWPAQSAERSGREDMSFGNGRWGSGQRQMPQDHSQQQRQQPHGNLNALSAAALYSASPRQSQPNLNALNSRVYGRAEGSASSVSGSRSTTPLSGNRSHQRSSLLTAPVNSAASSHAQRASDFLANLANPVEPPAPSPNQAVTTAMYSGLPFQSTTSNFPREQVSSPYQPHVTTYPATMPGLPVVDTQEETVQYSESHPDPAYSQPTSRMQNGQTAGSSSYRSSHNHDRTMNLDTRRDHYAYQKPPTPEVPTEHIPSRSNATMAADNYNPAVSRGSPVMGNSYESSNQFSSSNGTGVANLLSNIRDQGHQRRISGQTTDMNAARTHNVNQLPPQPATAPPLDPPRYQNSHPSPTAHMPGFVDPSFIYDPYHDERRRAQAAEIEAERNRPAEEVNNAESPPTATYSNDQQVAADAHEIAVSALNAGTAVVNTEEGANNPAQDKPEKKPRKKPEKKQPKKKSAAASNPKEPKKRGPRPRKSTANDAANPTPSDPNPFGQGSSASIANLLTPTQEEPPQQDMASEMKMMIDKMREFKSKDPSLFSKLWEDLKKGQPQATNGAPVTQGSQGDQRTSAPAPEHRPKTVEQQESSNGQNGAAKKDEQLPDLGNLPGRKQRGRPKKQPGTASPASEKKKKDVGKAPMVQEHSPLPGAPSSAPQRSSKPSTKPNLPKPPNGYVEASQSISESTAPASTAIPAGGTASDLHVAQSGAPSQEKSSNSASETLWPEEKQKSVAHEVAKHLLSDPRNRDKNDPESLVLAYIDRKPSYGDLCQIIESRGFVLDRGDLARHILRVIPDLNGNASRPTPPGQQAQQQLQQSQQSSTSSHPSEQIHPPIGSVQFNNVGPSDFTHPPGINNKPQAPNPSSTNINTTSAVVHNNQKATQQGLPQTSSGPYTDTAAPSQSSPPAPTSHSGKSSIPHILRDSPGVQSQPTALRQSQAKVGTSPNNNRLPKGYRVASVSAHAPPPNSKEAMARKREFSDIVDLTQGLSDEEDEEPVSKMPRSVESLPVPPTLPSQVNTLESAPVTPEQVLKPPRKMDLSPFKRPEPDSTSKRESLRRYPEIAKPINKAEALRTSYYDPKTIARDILIAAGRHPTERSLNAHLSKLQQTFLGLDSSSNLETFRWDLVDPGGPACPNVEPVPVITQPPELFKPDPRSSALKQTEPSDSTMAEQSRGTLKKRASPSLNAKIHVGAPSHSHHRRSHLHISQTVGSAENEKVTPTTHRKENIVQDSPTMTPTSTPSIPARRGRGRPRKSESRYAAGSSAIPSRRVEVAVPIRQPPPKYSVYECKWDECNSKLHNIETLQKHFQKVHEDFEDDRTLSCLWSGCRVRGNGASSLSFTPEELHDHVWETHFEPMAWNLGEGPSAKRHDGLDLERVLNDANGRTVTPATAKNGNRDALLLPAGSVPIRAFHKTHGNVTDFAKAREMVQALRWKKNRIGLGLDRGGCTVANAQRLHTVRSYEYVFEFVDDSEEDHLPP